MHRTAPSPLRVLASATVLFGTLACTPPIPVPGPTPPEEVFVEDAEPETVYTFGRGEEIPVELTAAAPEDGGPAEPFPSGSEAQVSFSHLEQSAECTVVLPEGPAEIGAGETQLVVVLECDREVGTSVLAPQVVVVGEDAGTARGRVVLSGA